MHYRHTVWAYNRGSSRSLTDRGPTEPKDDFRKKYYPWSAFRESSERTGILAEFSGPLPVFYVSAQQNIPHLTSHDEDRNSVRHGQPMFTVKLANDEEEFYEAVKRIKEALEVKVLWEEMEDAYSGGVRSLQNLLLPATPSSSEASTSPSPSPPHAADAP